MTNLVDRESVQRALNAYNPNNYLDLDHPASIAALVDRRTPESIYMKKAAMMDLSEDARWVINFLIQSPDAIWCKFLSNTGRFIRENLHRRLYTEYKWSWTRIWRVMKELRTYVNELE